MTVFHLLSIAFEAIQIIGLLASLCAIVVERGEDLRFKGERLWYRS